MLGNLAVDNDLALTIRINTIASYDDSSSDNTDSSPTESDNKNEYGLEGSVEAPKTGVTIGAIPITLTLALAVMLSARPKRREDEAENK